ncbi:unknown [Prevotella sp. CAG:1320]|nr:unknown [Prevotella sp. CAG:1320]
MEKYSYLCNVFFIVLDLRLTRLDYGGSPFFMSLS